jgi:predicted MFS family arabinose efflux permease
LGGIIIAEWGFEALFNVCALMGFTAFIFTFFLREKIKK